MVGSLFDYAEFDSIGFLPFADGHTCRIDYYVSFLQMPLIG
jgi:hypothetical protein